MRCHLLLVGFGHVGRRFVELLDELRPALAARQLQVTVAGIVTARHGAIFEKTGLDAIRLARQVADGRPLGPAGPDAVPEGIARLRSQDAEARVLVETTPLDIGSGEPAITHVRGALAAGVHVITANKGPVAHAYRALAAEADRAGVSLLFEGAVMDGIPVFSLVRDTLPAVSIRGFRGVVNSTTNYILTAMEQGEAFEAALGRMRAAGITEADPSLDVDGWDAAAKTAALANVWLDAGLTPAAVTREGLGPDTAARARAARERGERLKLVASARRHDGRVEARVRLEALPAGDPLAILDGEANAIELDTWPAGRIVITQRDGGLEKTAYALVADLLTLTDRIGRRR